MPRPSALWSLPSASLPSVAFSAAPTPPPKVLGATPRLNESIFCSLLNRNCAATGLTPAGGAGDPVGGGSAPDTSVASSVPGGGDRKSFELLLHFPPPWQVWQPAWKNSVRPALIAVGSRPPTVLLPAAASSVPVSGLFGVRTAKRTHSFIASSAGQAVVLPGKVTVSCGRPALGFRNELTTLGAALMSPLSPISRPWFGSSVLAGAGAGRLPGPDTLRMLASKSCTSSKIAE